jgi:hypothetical protein
MDKLSSPPPDATLAVLRKMRAPRRGLSDGGRVAVEERRLISAVHSRSSIERASRPF